MKVMDDEPIILLLYVDDLFLIINEKQITYGKKNLVEEFKMKDIGLMHYLLWLEVWKSPKGVFLNQGNYVIEILKRFDMLDCKFMATPMDTNLKLLFDETSKLMDMTQYRQIIGSLMYPMNIRPDICFVVDTLS